MTDERVLCRNDVWILQAMDARTGRHSSLTEIISHADALNHAIPGFAELCRAVSRLCAFGLVVVDNEMCEVTDSGRQTLAACRGRDFLDQNERIAQHLGAGAWELIAWASDPPEGQQFVTRERFENALYEYRRRF
jgi:hypothetical protein